MKKEEAFKILKGYSEENKVLSIEHVKELAELLADEHHIVCAKCTNKYPESTIEQVELVEAPLGKFLNKGVKALVCMRCGNSVFVIPKEE